MNQQLIIQYPCGCKWMVPATVDVVPRNCPEHWLADKAIKLESKGAPQ